MPAYDLSRMSLREVSECSVALRGLGAGARSMEEAANRIVRHLYDELGDGQGRACALVRFYKTHPYGELEPPLREFARGVMGGEEPSPAVNCLTLLATVGDEPAWRSRRASTRHQTIPLPGHDVVERLPMVAQLINQLGVPVEAVVASDPSLLLDLQQRTFNVFHVPTALGSPYIPAQAEFVVPHGIRSALGFGGILPSGDLFAIIFFSRAEVNRETADLFKPLALSAKLAVLPFASGPIFADEAESGAA